MDTHESTSLIVFLKKWIVPLCGGSVFLSVLCESYITLPDFTPYIFIVVSVFFFVVFAYKKNRIVLAMAIFFICSSLGVYRFHQEKEYRRTMIHLIENINGFRGKVKVVSAPDFRDTSTKVIVEYNDARLLVTLPKNTDIEYGDYIDIQGDVHIPESFETDQGRIFNYSGYLAKDRVFYEIQYPEFIVYKNDEEKSFLKTLYRFKNAIKKKISESHKSDEEGLLLGILLGERGGIKAHQDAFIKTGTIHIVALSGYNVAIISEAIAYLLIPLFGVSLGLSLGVIGVVVFAIMTGLGATILRATLMGILAFTARISGKTYNAGRALLVAGVVMIALNPWILAYDVSFQLSFIATLGLVYYTPLISRWFLWVTHKGLHEIISATVATNICVLPFVAYKMGIVSLVSIPTNILIAPLVPLSMLFGSFSVALFSVFPPLSIPFVKISSFILSLIITIAEKGSASPVSSVVVPEFSVFFIASIYAVLIGYASVRFDNNKLQ